MVVLVSSEYASDASDEADVWLRRSEPSAEPEAPGPADADCTTESGGGASEGAGDPDGWATDCVSAE
jgi:hypothetical protein